MRPQDALREVLLGLQTLFANEGRPGGTQAALAIGAALDQLPEVPMLLGRTMPGPEGLLDVGAGPPADPVAIAALAAGPLIPWYHAGLDDGKIPAEVATRMLTAELLGPDGLLPNPALRLGLFYQGPGLDYPIRSHAAEETFIMLAGEGHWSLDGTAHAPRGPGAVLFHPSLALHGSRTTDRPLLAAWRWGGEIGWESYKIA